MKISTFLPLIILTFLFSCNSNSNSEQTDPVNENIEQAESVSEVEESSLDGEEEISQIHVGDKDEHLENNPEPGLNTVQKNSEVQISKKVVSKYAFINAQKGLDIGDEVTLNLASYAVEDVEIQRDGLCDTDCGKMVYAMNHNEQKRIAIVAQVKWKVDKEKMEKLRVYELSQGEKVHLGCTQDCNNDLAVRWKIVSAEYID